MEAIFVSEWLTNEQVTPGFNHWIPEKVMTPDRVETRIGTLEFFDGIVKRGAVRISHLCPASDPGLDAMA